jgi:class 3 adenylate cyclase
MADHNASQILTVEFTPPRPIAEYPKDSIKKMAVLFTDIVGSSKFFKTHGDIAGRKMLKQHQNMASPAIKDHGGFVVKFLGDSVMAYFFDAREALKSAIKIQQKFRRFNGQKEQEDQIHVRIAIHYGDGIVEEKDIFGDVVNTAAKFLPLVEGDQVCVSKEVYDQVRDLAPLRFESIKISNKKGIPKGLSVYRAVWDDGINLDPLTKTLVYLNPIWKLGRNNFERVWDDLIRLRADLWTDRIEKEKVFSDRSIALILRRAPSSLTFAKNVIDFLKLNLGKDAVPFLPVQILIDAGPYQKAEKLSLEDLKVSREEFEPGATYISDAAYRAIKATGNTPVLPLTEKESKQPFYKLNLNDQTKSETHLFLYQEALVQGDESPCFYCGDRRHPTAGCPSKQLSEITHYLSKFGYLSIDTINNLFFNYLTGRTAIRGPAPDSSRGKNKGAQQWPYYCFYELKAVFQLRFFRSLWNNQAENWGKIKEMKDDSDRGGLVWIGQDCIRVSNFDQATSILKDSLKNDPQDYKPYCASGFLSVERNNFLQAKTFFKEALAHSRTTPQRIFILFLLARIFELSNNLIKAKELVNKIIALHPYCYEAIYQDIIYKFRQGKNAVALQHLTRLIKKNREYFVHALIDPELAAYSDIIHPQLNNLLNEARQRAKETSNMAQEELENLERFLGKDDKEVVSARELWSKREEVSKADSYFGYLDIIHYGGSVIDISYKSLETRRRGLYRRLSELKQRLEKCQTYVGRYHYPYLIGSVQQQLKLIKTRFDKNWEIVESKAKDKYKEAAQEAEEIATELDQISLKLKRLDMTQKVMLFATRFFKKSLVFQSVNVLIALLLFPIVAHYLNFLVPRFYVTPQNIWVYQKWVLLVGGLSGLFLTILSTTRTMPEKWRAGF